MLLSLFAKVAGVCKNLEQSKCELPYLNAKKTKLVQTKQ